MKKLIFDILLIVVISSSIALIYNYYSAKPLPLIKVQEVLTEIPDSLLFDHSESQLIEPPKKDSSTIITDVNKKDSLKAKKDSIKNALKLSTLQSDSLKKENLTITFNQMKKIIDNPKYIIIDARNTDNYSAGHIGNAINIHPYWEPNEYFPKITSLPKDKTIIIYCDGGNCDLSHKLEKDLINFGYSRVFIYVGGWDDWKKKSGI